MENLIGQKTNAFLLLADNPVLLTLFCIMLAIIALGAVVFVIAKNNPNLFNKLLDSASNAASINAKLKKIDDMLRDDAHEGFARQSEMDKRFDAIETEIGKLFSIVTDHEEFANTLSRGTLENMLFNDALPVFRRLKAFRKLTAMRANGRVKRKGLILILNNQETWLDVLDVKMDMKIADQKYYDDVLDEINRRVYDRTA